MKTLETVFVFSIHQTIEGAGHFVEEHRSAELAELIARFVGSGANDQNET